MADNVDDLFHVPTTMALVTDESFNACKISGRTPVTLSMSDAKLSTAMRTPSQSSDETTMGVATPLLTMGKLELERS